MPIITLPDGSQRRFDDAVTVAQIAAAIGPGLAKAALAGRVNGKLVDLSRTVSEDVEVAIVTDKDPEGLDIIRHSTAHLMAYAVQDLFPEAQVTIGPVIENGFYYDFAYKRPFTPEYLAAIELSIDNLAKLREMRDKVLQEYVEHGGFAGRGRFVCACLGFGEKPLDVACRQPLHRLSRQPRYRRV